MILSIGVAFNNLRKTRIECTQLWTDDSFLRLHDKRLNAYRRVLFYIISTTVSDAHVHREKKKFTYLFTRQNYSHSIWRWSMKIDTILEILIHRMIMTVRIENVFDKSISNDVKLDFRSDNLN